MCSSDLGGVPVTVATLGEVVEAPKVRLGAVTHDAAGETVVGIAMMQQGENASDGLSHIEPEEKKKPVTDERSQDTDQNVDAVGGEHRTDGWIGVATVVRKDGQLRNTRADDIEWQQEQRLADAVPVVESSVAAMHAEFRIFIREYRRFGSPERMCRLQTVHRIRRPRLPRLHAKREQAGSQR